MNQQTESFTWKSLLLTGAFLAAFSSCGGGGGNGGGVPDPTPDPDPTPEVTTGEVTFTPDWGSLPASSALRFHFYPATGAVVTKDCDSKGFSGTLATGTYNVLAYNTDATGVMYENTDTYDKAAVRVTPASTRALSVVNQPGQVYALNMENLSVEKGGTASPVISLRPLVKTLALRLSIDDGSIISSLRGYVNGFFPSVLLSTGKPSAEVSVSSVETGIAFNVTISGNEGNADLNSLGMLDPQHGNAYQCTLLLDITVTDGRNTQITVDLSEALTQILAENAGELPGGSPAGITVGLKVVSNSEMTFQGSVIDWVKGEDSTGVL